ncbi:MAG: hypothetical protein HQ559_15025, partial [Lentisphaerae bacterium]|nr:hypothetical protein [Lentisphaerota bacterium]
MSFTDPDRQILRDLATRLAELADDPDMQTRRDRWVEHNSLRSSYPMMLIFPEGSWGELLPDTSWLCRDDRARDIEGHLRMRIYGIDHFQDDNAVVRDWPVPKVIHSTGWGLSPQWIPSPEARGARLFDPVIHEPSDLGKLRHPQISWDEDASLRNLEDVQALFGDILDVRLSGAGHVSYHLMNQYTALRGLEEVMMDMYTEPQMLHDAMAFLEEGNRRILQQYTEQDLLAVNNDNTYQSSGGNGWTDELPLPDCDPNHVRPQDMWASAEA